MRPESLGAARSMTPAAAGAAAPGAPRRSDWATLAQLLPYLWAYRGRVLLALGFLTPIAVAGIGSHTAGGLSADMYEHGPEWLGYPADRVYRFSYRGIDGPESRLLVLTAAGGRGRAAN